MRIATMREGRLTRRCVGKLEQKKHWTMTLDAVLVLLLWLTTSDFILLAAEDVLRIVNTLRSRSTSMLSQHGLFVRRREIFLFQLDAQRQMMGWVETFITLEMAMSFLEAKLAT